LALTADNIDRRDHLARSAAAIDARTEGSRAHGKPVTVKVAQHKRSESDKAEGNVIFAYIREWRSEWRRVAIMPPGERRL